MTLDYRETYQAWLDEPLKFWADASNAIDWFEPPSTVFDPNAGVYGRWFPDGICNTCYNAVDRHAIGDGAQRTALIHASPVTQSVRKYTYAEMLDEVVGLAKVLRMHHVEKGDRVLIYMPMVPEAVFAMLACARIGAVHSVVFGGFAAPELSKRVDDATPKLVISASCGIEGQKIIPYLPILREAIELSSHKPACSIVLRRKENDVTLESGSEIDFEAAVTAEKSSAGTVDCVALKATDPLYILYTSGTTGRPKGVVRDNGGHMVALHWSMTSIYGMTPNDTYWAASDIGWVVGHSYIVYAPLLLGCTTVLYEGKPVGTPDASAFWRVIADHKVSAMFVAPTALRAIRKVDPDLSLAKSLDMGSLKTLFLAGERSDPDIIRWAETQLSIPVIDHWWQTETAWSISANPVGLGTLPVRYGSAGVAMPGYAIDILDDDGKVLPAGQQGNIAIQMPLPPGSFPTLWNADERMRETYLSAYPGYYATADSGYVSSDGYLYILGRTDDVINVAGHRLSTGAIEEVIAAHPAVAECAVVGFRDTIKGQVPLAFVVLKQGTTAVEVASISADLQAAVRRDIGPVASLRAALLVERLPKTRSGKILRGTMQKIAGNEDWTMPAAIDDPLVLDEIAFAVRQCGISGSAS